MRSLIFIVTIFTTSLIAEMVDLGRQGEVFEITEKPLEEMIHERAADINYSKAEEDFYKDYEAMYTFEHILPMCDQEKNSSTPNIVIVPHDISDQKGNIVFRKGQEVPYSLPLGASFALCFIDGSKEVDEQLKALDQSGINCEIAVSNKDSRYLSELYNRELNPLNKIILSRVEIPCYPSAFEFTGSEIKEHTFIPIRDER